MSFTRREVTDGVTVMNKDLYDNLQDGVEGIFSAEGTNLELITSEGGIKLIDIVGNTVSNKNNPTPNNKATIKNSGDIKEDMDDCAITLKLYKNVRNAKTLTKRLDIILDSPLRSVDDFHDTICKINGVWGVLRKIHYQIWNDYYIDKVQFSTSNTGNQIVLKLENVEVMNDPTKVLMLSDIAVGIPINSYEENESKVICCSGVVGNDSCICIKDTPSNNFFTNLTAVKNYLTNVSSGFSVVRATPVFEPLAPEIQKLCYELESYEDKTYIEVFDEVTTPISVLYGQTKVASTSLKNYNELRRDSIITTISSPNADYSEVGEWSDGNEEAEDRIGYFVSVDSNSEAGVTMVKATNTSDIRGVTVSSPAFSANDSIDKHDLDGNLLSKYDYVAFAGFVSVIDNGTCIVNKKCVSSDDGTAIPSPNEYGYQVIDRIDEDHILILVEPQGDSLSRIDEEILIVKESVSGFVDKTTVFNEDGSIVETTSTDTKTTVFNEDGSITETLVSVSGTTSIKTTVFNPDGSITETVTRG